MAVSQSLCLARDRVKTNLSLLLEAILQLKDRRKNSMLARGLKIVEGKKKQNKYQNMQKISDSNGAGEYFQNFMKMTTGAGVRGRRREEAREQTLSIRSEHLAWPVRAFGGWGQWITPKGRRWDPLTDVIYKQRASGFASASIRGVGA
jgi:hypothetical protein